MNAGAAAATGDWLLFVHADSRLTHPRQIHDGVLRLARDRPQATAGHFALRFAAKTDAPRFFYRYVEAKSATNRRYTINGDQGVLIHRDLFAALGGFDTRLPFLEDQRLAAAVEQRGRWRLLAHPLETSARRFETEGRGARYLLMALIMAMYCADVPAFFTGAPAVYPRQAHSGRLALMPYFRLLRRLARDCGWRASLRAAWRISGVALGQSWQCFFVLDVAVEHLVGGRRRWFTRLHDRLLRPLIVHRPAQALLLVLLVLIVFGPLQVWCGFREARGSRP